MHRDWLALVLVILLPAADLWWNLAHLNIGLVDFYGLSAFARSLAQHGAWPATPYFPAGYPLLLIPFGFLGSTLVGGYILSALGLMLALYAAWLLAREFGADRDAAVLAVILCWAAPVCRVTAGSPSVDTLYTGLGLWFCAGAVAAWRYAGATSAAFPRWATCGLIVPALLLPLLRYHAAVLLLPVLLVLVLWGRRPRTALLALAGAAAVISFNYASYNYFYSEPLASTAKIQIATGLEQRYHKIYSDAGAVWENYPQFARRIEYTPLLELYRPAELAGHWARSWAMFLRQPAVLLFALLAAALALRRRLARGAFVGLLWLLAYTAVLATAYYTARSAALPVMFAAVLCIGISSRLAEGQARRWLPAAAGGLLCIGYIAASSFALQDCRDRAAWARRSQWLNRYTLQHGLAQGELAVSDWRLLPLRNNPWTAPYVTTTHSWMSDPRIQPEQTTGIELASPADLMSRANTCRGAAVVDAGQGSQLLIMLQQELDGYIRWHEVARDNDLIILAPGAVP